MDKCLNKTKNMLFTIQWQITSLCSNRCKHCYIQNYDDDSISYEQFCDSWKKIDSFEEQYNVNISRIVLTGGDPFLNVDFWKILELLKNKNKEISILGMPEEISSKNVKRLKEFGVCHYQVSLDGLPRTHDAIRGNNSFERTIYALKNLTENQIEHTVMFTINTLNYHELIPLMQYLDQEKINTYFTFDFMIGDVLSKNGMPCMISPEMAQQVLIDFSKFSTELQSHNSTLKLIEKNSLSKVLKYISDGFAGERVNDYPFCNGCSNGLYSLAILPNGDVYPCRRLPIKIGNIFVQEFDQIFLEHELMKKFRNSENYIYCKDCSYFNICRGCPAISYYYTGDPFKKYPYCFIKKEDKRKITVNCSTLESILQCEPNIRLNMEKKDYLLHLLNIYSNKNY